MAFTGKGDGLEQEGSENILGLVKFTRKFKPVLQ